MPIWRPVLVFLSSTFRDMHAERDHLINAVFPRLRERLVPHRVELTDIDLRWGITALQAENEQVLGLCLGRIDECRPFFLGFLGHRYGWVPARLPDDARRDFPWIDRHPGASLTELEMRHGALNREKPARAMFCLRDRPALESIPEPTRSKLFGETDAGNAGRLEALREELRGSGHAVRDYTGRWDRGAYDRPSRTQGRLVELHGFGEAVEEWLWRAVADELGLGEGPAAVDPLDEEADFHERFLESRLRVYVGRDDDDAFLRAFALDDDEVPCLVTGPSGCGKSAVLARFVERFRRARPEVFVLAHFVGASARTTSLHGLLGRLCGELKRRYDFGVAVPDEPAGRVTVFLGLLASVPETQRLVLVLDALNQLDDGGGAETLHWLPERLPAHVKLIASSVTGPGRPPRVLSAFGEREARWREVGPLSDGDRRDILAAVPKLAAKALDEKQRAALLANPATASPLFLLTALEELRLAGSFESLDACIAALPREGDSVTALFEQVFGRLEEDYDRELVERVVSSLACARRGLADDELRELTADCKLGGEVFAVLRQLRAYLLRREGRWDFYHDSVRRAAVRHYLKGDPDAEGEEPTAEERRARRRLVAYFGERTIAFSGKRSILARLWQWIRPHVRKRRLDPRAVEELPWQLARLRDWQGLYEVLADVAFFEAAWRANEFEVREHWATMERESPFRMVEAYAGVVSKPGGCEAGIVWELAELFQTTGHLDEAGALRAYLIEHHRGTSERAYGANLGNQALILKARGDLDGAMRLHEEEEAICRRLGDPAGLGRTLGNQALVLKARGDLDGAMRLHEEEEAICRRLGDPAGLQACLGNQALVLKARGDLDGAMRLLGEQEATCRRLGDPAGLQRSLGNQALILKARGDLDGAMRLHEEEEAICRRLGDPAELQACLGNQALILKARGDLDGAMRLHKEQEAICRRLGDPAGLGRTLGNQALVLKARGDLDGAMRLHEEEEAICRRLGDPAGLQACLGNQALVLKARGDLDGAMRLLGEQEAICRRLGDPAELQACLGNQALILQARGDLDGAMRLHKEQEAICRRLGDPAGLQACLGNQALILQARGDLDGAMRLHKEQEAICRRLGDPAGLGRTLGNQALVLKARGDLDGAMRLHEEEEAICRRLGDPAGLGRTLGNQALVLKARGDLDGAMRLHEEEEAICRRLGDPAGLQARLGNQALVLKARGDLDGAMRLLGEQEATCRRLGDPAGLQRSLGNQALILKARGDLDGAMRLHEEEEAICRRLGDPAGLAISLANQARLLAPRQDRAALPLAEEALRLATAHGLTALAAQIEPIIAQIRARAGG